MRKPPKVISKKPRITVLKLKKLCWFLRSWRRQVQGERVERKRHYLKNDVLAGFTSSELIAAIAWAEIGRSRVRVTFKETYAAIASQMAYSDPVNVIYDFDLMECFIPQGLATAQGIRGAVRKNPEINEERAKEAAMEMSVLFPLAA